MTYREKDIAYENGRVWVLKKSESYTVFVSGVTHSTSDSAYELSDAGFSIAKARADYLARKLRRTEEGLLSQKPRGTTAT